METVGLLPCGGLQLYCVGWVLDYAERASVITTADYPRLSVLPTCSVCAHVYMSASVTKLHAI